MSDLLRQYIMEVVSQVNDPRVPNQLIPKKSKKDSSKDKESDKEQEQEMDEVNVVANIAGFTGPLGASSADMGANPTKPGKKLKKHKRDFVRWK